MARGIPQTWHGTDNTQSKGFPPEMFSGGGDILPGQEFRCRGSPAPRSPLTLKRPLRPSREPLPFRPLDPIDLDLSTNWPPAPAPRRLC